MPVTNEVGHGHVGVCFPYRQTVSGTLAVSVTVLMHDNSGTVYRIRPHDGQTGTVYEDRIVNWTPGVGTFSRTWTFDLDTTRVNRDGWQEFRFFVQVKEPDGREMYVSSGYQAYLANGNPVDHYRDSAGLFTEGRGWYTDFNYTIARIDSPIPNGPISGIWQPHVHLKPGAGGGPVTFHAAYIDPAFHHGSEGVVVRQGSGQFIGNLSIDTTTLAAGPHRLVLRADSEVSGETNSGVLVIPFEVAP